MLSSSSWTTSAVEEVEESGGLRSLECDLVMKLHTNAMGLTFANPVGLAAGVDRSGQQAAALSELGFGHVEIGTVVAGQAAMIDAPRCGSRLGINIGSSRQGLDPQVIEDYATALRAAYESADYLCANLSSPFAGRDGDTIGVDQLVSRMKREVEACAARIGRRVPLLIKVEGGFKGSPLPAAIAATRHHGLDGLVLVSTCPERIAAICQYINGATVISVGGIASGADISARLGAGASLVQIYTAFVRDGALGLHRMFREFEAL